MFSEKNPFFHLRAVEIEELLGGSELRVFASGVSLFRAGEPVLGIYCISEGVVKISQQLHKRHVTVRFAADSDWVGHRSIFTRANYLGSATARERTRALFVPSALLFSRFARRTRGSA